MSDDKLLNPREAALLLNRSHEWVYTQIRRGLIPIQLVERIGLTVPPAIRIEKGTVRKLARRLRRIDEGRAARRQQRQERQSRRPPPQSLEAPRQPEEKSE